ncbi:hypothetical protein EV1_040228 [Malus domestica]
MAFELDYEPLVDPYLFVAAFWDLDSDPNLESSLDLALAVLAAGPRHGDGGGARGGNGVERGCHNGDDDDPYGFLEQRAKI